MEERAKHLSEVDRAILAMVRDRTARGETLKSIAKTSGISHWKLHALASGASDVRYPNKWASREQQREALRLVRAGHSLRKAASYCGMSRSAVHRLVKRQRERELDRCGSFRVTDLAARYSAAKRYWECPTHGRVTVWPCVACAAIAAKEAKSADQ